MLTSTTTNNVVEMPEWMDSRTQLTMLAVSILISGFITIYVGLKVRVIWKRSKLIEKEAHDEAQIEALL